MYDEDDFKSQIFWLKVKRCVIIILSTIIGAILGVVLTSFLVQVLSLSDSLRKIIIVGLVLIFFLLSLLCTSNTGRMVQDAYWKIAMYKKLSEIADQTKSLSKIDKLIKAIEENTEQ